MGSPPPEPRLDFPFTQRDTPALRKRIENDLAHVARRAHAADPHLAALVLTGGFSRGEGTALRDAPVNDYDLVAIRARPGGGDLYRTLGPHLTREVGIEVDLMPIWARRLPHVGRKLFWLDARLGARVIAGDPRLLDLLPRFERVAREEVARLLGNRAAGMLLSLPAADETPDEHQRDLQATKAILAAMDAALLAQGRYAPRMRERLGLARDHPDHDTFRIAVEWKLRPTRTLPSGYWEQARDALLRAVDATRARHTRDGLVEHALHLARAKRLRPNPSQAVRRRAWDLLARCTWPEGPRDEPAAWTIVKRDFFAARAATLQ